MKRSIWTKLSALVISLLLVLTGCGSASVPSQADTKENIPGTAAESASSSKAESEYSTDVPVTAGTAETAASETSTETPQTAPEFIDNFVLEVDEPYITEEDGVLFSVRLTYNKTSPASLELLRENETIGTLADDGQNGDAAAGDGIYSLFVDKPVQSGKQASFSAKVGSQNSESVTVNLFLKPSEEEIQKEQEAIDTIQEAVNSITIQDWTEEKRTEIDVLLSKLQEMGSVRFYSIDDNGFFVKLDSGLGNIFNPSSEGTQAPGANTEVEISIYEMEHFGKDYYPDVPAKEFAELLANYSKGKDYKGKKCSRDAILQLHKNQMILWNGHGRNVIDIGPCLLLGENFDWLAYQLNNEYHNDCVKHLLINSPGCNIIGDGNLVVSSKYIDKYCGDISGSFLYLSACHSAQSDQLVNAFISKGAAAVFGYTEEVKVSYSSPFEKMVFQKLMEINQKSHDFYTLKDAVNNASEKLGKSDAVSPYNGKGAAPRIVGGTNAENYRISKAGAVYGTVTDKDGKKITGAKITFQRIGSDGKKSDYSIEPKQSSDASGNYEVWLPPTGFVIQITASGYKTYSKEITIGYGKKQKLDIKLTSDGSLDHWTEPGQGTSVSLKNWVGTWVSCTNNSDTITVNSNNTMTINGAKYTVERYSGSNGTENCYVKGKDIWYDISFGVPGFYDGSEDGIIINSVHYKGKAKSVKAGAYHKQGSENPYSILFGTWQAYQGTWNMDGTGIKSFSIDEKGNIRAGSLKTSVTFVHADGYMMDFMGNNYYCIVPGFIIDGTIISGKFEVMTGNCMSITVGKDQFLYIKQSN